MRLVFGMILGLALGCGGKTTATESAFPDDLDPPPSGPVPGCFCPSRPPPATDASPPDAAPDADLDAADLDAGLDASATD
jgi:hypothetical protein